MKKIVFVTNLPAFYKINLYDELAKQAEVSVYFLDHREKSRNDDFYKISNNFRHTQFKTKNWGLKVFLILKDILFCKGGTVVLSEWNRIEAFLLAFMSPKRHNAIVVESSVIESTTTGLKGLMKRLLLSRISEAYVPGESNKKLLEALKFKGKIIKTYGVGIFNYVEQAPYAPKQIVSKFIFVGRLISEKNLLFLIEYFNHHPDLTLSIVGFGALESSLKNVANDNILFLGAIDNLMLSELYRDHDVFILPSLSEPWGLVVEEALNNGLPVLVSDKVGCAEEIVNNDENGYIFNLDGYDSLDSAVKKIVDVDKYNELALNISKYDVSKVVDKQVSAYL